MIAPLEDWMSVNVNLPFLDWQTLYWQNKQAKADFDSAKLTFEQSLTTALNEVARYYQQYSLSRVTLANTEQKYKLFADGTNPLGQVILFNKRPLRVIGVTAPNNNGFMDSDSLQLYTPYTTLMNI